MALNIAGIVRVLVAALCLQLATAAKLISWSPAILSPVKGDLWTAGQPVTVKWDPRDAPETITSRGKISLYRPCQAGSVYQDLITDFDQLAGNVTFTLPGDLPKGPAFFVLFGSSDNYSPVINIV